MKAHAASAVRDDDKIVLHSDRGLFRLECSLASTSGRSEVGGIAAVETGEREDEAPACTLGDLLHLLLTSLAGRAASQTSPPDNSFSFLRRAVGVNNVTAALPELDPRRLFPRGVELLMEGVSSQTEGVLGMLQFAASRGLVQMTSRSGAGGEVTSATSEKSSPSSLLADLWIRLTGQTQEKGRSGVSRQTSVGPQESLVPSKERAYSTLGSDMECTYLNKFLR